MTPVQKAALRSRCVELTMAIDEIETETLEADLSEVSDCLLKMLSYDDRKTWQPTDPESLPVVQLARRVQAQVGALAHREVLVLRHLLKLEEELLYCAKTAETSAYAQESAAAAYRHAAHLTKMLLERVAAAREQALNAYPARLTPGPLQVRWFKGVLEIVAIQPNNALGDYVCSYRVLGRPDTCFATVNPQDIDWDHYWTSRPEQQPAEGTP